MILLDVDVLGPQGPTPTPNTADDLLNSRLVDKVIEPQLVGVLELELVVVCQQTNQAERGDDIGRGLDVMYELEKSADVRHEHT